MSKKLDKKGILIKSSDEGLIDFPHIRSNGEEVYLCWKVGAGVTSSDDDSCRRSIRALWPGKQVPRSQTMPSEDSELLTFIRFFRKFR